MLLARGLQTWQHPHCLGGRAARCAHPRSACGCVELAGRGAGAQAVRPRRRSVRGRPAPRHRHRRSDGSRRARSGHGGRLLRRPAAARGALRDDPHRGRVLRHPRPPGINRVAGRDGGRRRGGRGDDRPERRARRARAVRPPRHPPDRRPKWVPRPAVAAARPGGSSTASSRTRTDCRTGRPAGGSRVRAGVRSAQAVACVPVEVAHPPGAPRTLAAAGLAARSLQACAGPAGGKGGGHASGAWAGSRTAVDSRAARARPHCDERARHVRSRCAPESTWGGRQGPDATFCAAPRRAPPAVEAGPPVPVRRARACPGRRRSHPEAVGTRRAGARNVCPVPPP
jgi:hypothetical protein